MSARTVWGVTVHPAQTGQKEGITIIELFDTAELATAFRDGYATQRPTRMYSVTKFAVWDGPIPQEDA
jgi:hypothetical protein